MYFLFSKAGNFETSITRVPYNKLLTNLACSSRTGEYWPSVVFVRTSLRSVRTATTSGQYSPVRPSRSLSKRLLCQLMYFGVIVFQGEVTRRINCYVASVNPESGTTLERLLNRSLVFKYLLLILSRFISGTSSFISRFTTKTMSSSHIHSSRHGIISGNYALDVCFFVVLYALLFVCFCFGLSWFRSIQCNKYNALSICFSIN